MAQPIWSWLYLDVCKRLLFLESWGLVNWFPAFFLYTFLFEQKYICYIPFSVSFYLDNFMGTCAFCMWASIIFLLFYEQTLKEFILWCCEVTAFSFSFLFYFIFAFSFKDMLSNKMFFPKPCMMMHFYLFSKYLGKELNMSYLIESQVS